MKIDVHKQNNVLNGMATSIKLDIDHKMLWGLLASIVTRGLVEFWIDYVYIAAKNHVFVIEPFAMIVAGGRT